MNTSVKEIFCTVSFFLAVVKMPKHVFFLPWLIFTGDMQSKPEQKEITEFVSCTNS
jgi:hypothetical protein